MLLKELLESAQLPAEFSTKAETIFEAAVNEQVAAQLVSIQESFDKKLAEEKTAYITEAVATLDAVIEETVLEWAKENAVALDNEIRSQLAESFLSGLKGLFEKADIELNSDTASTQIAALTEAKQVADKAAEDAKAALVEAEQKLVAIKVKEIIAEATAGLADTVAARAAKLCEAFDFKSEDDFRAKAAMIVEAVGGKKVDEKKIEGTIDADGVQIPVTTSTNVQPQADTSSGAAPSEELVAKPAIRPEVHNADGLKEQVQALKEEHAPHYGEDLVAATMALLK